MPRAVGAEEAFALVPGMKVDNQADGERVHMSIRGQGLLTERGIRGIKVLLDGLPLNDPTGFAPDLFDVDWQAVQRIEVLRGSASALYGGGSSGGVINITTRDGGTGAPRGHGLARRRVVQLSQGVRGGRRDAGKRQLPCVGVGQHRRTAIALHTKFHATNLYGKFRFKAGDSTTLTAIVAGTHFYNDNAEGLNLAWFTQNLGQGVEGRRQANPDALTFNEYQRTRPHHDGRVGPLGLAANQELSYAVYYRNTGWRESVPSSVQHRTYNTPGLQRCSTPCTSAEGPLKNHLTVGSDLDWQGIDEYRHPNLGKARRKAPEFLSKQTINQRGIGLYVLDRVELGPAVGR